MYSHDDDTKKDAAKTDQRPEPQPGPQPALEDQAKVVDAQVTGIDEQAGRLADLEARVAELESRLAEAGEQVAALAGERDTWQSKATAIYDQYLRAKSDFDGFRKRTERDLDDRLTRGKADFLRALLEVLDNFERFLDATEKSGLEGGERGFDAFFRGVAMIERQLMDALLKEGAEPIENPVGKHLDPEFHDAVAAQEGGGEHGMIVEELQKGYVYKGLVLRPSKVKAIR